MNPLTFAGVPIDAVGRSGGSELAPDAPISRRGRLYSSI
jgi:hypothetical protein